LATGLPDLQNPIWLGYLINLMGRRHNLINITLEGMSNLLSHDIVAVHVTEEGYDIIVNL
jgi:hypothetical protein